MLQQGTFKPGPLEIAMKMAKTRQFGSGNGILHYSAGLHNQPIALSSGTVVKSRFQVDKVTRKDSLFVVDSLIGFAEASLFQVLLYDQGRNPLADAPLSTNVVFGTADAALGIPNLPFVLDECIVVDCPSPIVCDLQTSLGGPINFTAVANGRIIERGAKPYDWFNKRRSRVFPYWMTTPTPMTFTALNQNRQFEIKNGNWYFQGLKFAAGSTAGDATYTLTDPIAKQVYMNGRVSSQSTIGTGALPTLFNIPLTLKPNSRLVLDVTNSFAGANQVWIAIFGRKIYARSAEEALEFSNSKEPI